MRIGLSFSSSHLTISPSRDRYQERYEQLVFTLSQVYEKGCFLKALCAF